jgi:hypothetical protein
MNNKPKISILLTATIDPKGMTFTDRNDPIVRENDYLLALEKYIANTSYPIVFCENSGYNLTRVKQTLVKTKREHEIIQFDGQNFPKKLGKGYGELLIIKHALEHSSILKNSDYIIKITGRYYSKNLNAVMSQLESEDDLFVLSDFNKDSIHTYSGVFAATPEFFNSYLIKYLYFLDDSKKQPMELALHKAIENAQIDQKKCSSFNTKLIVEGYSGTHNVKIAKANYNDIVFSLPKLNSIIFPKLKRIARYFGLLK